MTFWIRTVILMVGLFCGISHAEDKPMVRCEASAVHIGGEGQVTCHYPMDLSHIDCVVSIEQFVDDSEKTVLECVRDRISQCYNVRQGYRVTNLTGNTLTVTIPKVTDEHMGRYGCSLADRMTSYGYDLCTFEVKNRKSRCEASVENIGGRGQVTCHYPMDLTGVHCVVDIVQFVDGAETHILSCLWEDIIQRDCTDVRQGYRITNFTGNTLTVTIPKVTDEHRGRYRCSLVDEIIHDYELCDVVEKRTTPHSSQPGSSMEKAVADQSDRTKVRCEASAVHIGGKGQVTCHYPMDLSHIDCIVSIEQFVDDSEKTVLDCVRDRISQCNNVRQGYRVTNVTGNTLTVTIPKVTDEHMGRYGCTLADRMTSYGYDLCTFEVKNRKSRCEASVENIGGRGQVTCHYPMDLTGVHCVVDIVQFVDGAETHILSCLWEDIIQRDCTDVRQGYRITNFTGNTLTVTIPKVTDEHRGRYRCSLVDEIIHDYELCDVVEKRTTPHSSQPESSMEKAVADQSDRTKVRCEASAVHIGGKGQVTCHYPMDLSHIDCIVSIEQFVDDSEITVLDCVWDSISQCDNVRQGYRVTNLTGNTLTVTIPKGTDEHMGRYGCSLADRMTSYASDLCTFEVKGTTPHSSQPESSSEKAAADQSDSDKRMSGGTIALLVIGVILITVLVVAVNFWTYRRRRCQKGNNPAQAPAKFVNSVDSEKNEVCTVDLDIVKGTHAVTGGKDTKYELPRYSPVSADSGYGDTKSENGDTTGSREEDDHSRHHSPTDPSKKRAMAGETGQTDPTSDSKDSTHEADVEEEEDAEEEEEEEEKEEELKGLLATPKTGM